MGYRNYLYIADKKKLNKVRKLSRRELFEFIGQNPDELDEFDDWLNLHEVLKKASAEEAFEMGEYIDYRNRLRPYLKRLFKDDAVHKEANEEDECLLAKPEILQELSTIYKEKVQAFGNGTFRQHLVYFPPLILNLFLSIKIIK